MRAFWSYPCGVPASCSSLWDGTHSLLNTTTNQAMAYGNGGAIDHAAFTSAVPEPGTWDLLLGGAAALRARRRA